MVQIIQNVHKKKERELVRKGEIQCWARMNETTNTFTIESKIFRKNQIQNSTQQRQVTDFGGNSIS